MKKFVRLGNALFLIMCIFMTRPYYVQMVNSLNKLWAYTTMAIAAIAVGYIVVFIKIKISRRLLLFFVCYLVATFLHLRPSLNSAVSTIAQSLLAYCVGIIAIKDSTNRKFRTLRKFIICILMVDVASILLPVSRILKIGKSLSFLGYDNYAAYLIVCLLTVEWYIAYTLYGTIRRVDILCWLGVFIAKVYTFSLNALIILLLFSVELVLINRKKQLFRLKISKLARPQVVFIVILSLLIGVHYFKVHMLFAKLLIALGKGVTLGYRTVIWSKTIAAIPKAPFLGYGYCPDGYFQQVVGFNEWDLEANHPHSLVLSILFSTGIVGAVGFWGYVFTVCKRLFKNFRATNNTILVLGVALYMLMGVADAYPFIFSFYIMMAFIEHRNIIYRFSYI